MAAPEPPSAPAVVVKEEDWELISGSKSLPLPDDKAETVDVSSADWYKTIPATPANTPEYTPLPPPYPTSSARKEPPGAADELEPILEAPEELPVEEERPSKDAEEKTPENSVKEANPEPSMPLAFFSSGFMSTLLYLAIFYALKQLVTKVWYKFRPPRAIPEKSE